ncbi:MAG TPA: signal peptide peptidase SppA [Isosphaeraceae bacterium]|jgi:protease-4|nr:signal peptide peptidase SppA [Isosphaeraceae bacterium]
MSEKENLDRPAPPPGPTVVVRRGRFGCLRVLFWPILIISVLLNMSLLGGGSAGLPTRLAEHYVAGSTDLSDPKVAVVEVEGTIAEGDTPGTRDAVGYALHQIRQARDDHTVKAVVLRIDSPGGTVSGSDRIWRELATLNGSVVGATKKPLVASMGGMAASGGYYIAAPADYIFAEPTTITGSIGVLMQMPKVYGLMKEYGVEMETIKSGPFKDSSSMFRPMTDRERARWQELIDDTYDRFVRVVAQGRKLPEKDVRALADGRVFTAREALKGKLINELGYLDDAISKAQFLAGLSKARVVRYQRQVGLADLLTGGLAGPAPGQLQLPLKGLDPDALLRLQTPRLYLLAR